MEVLFFIILTAVISSLIEHYRDKNKYFRAREEGSTKKVKDLLSGIKHRDLADALEKIKELKFKDRNTGIRVPREEYLEKIKEDICEDRNTEMRVPKEDYLEYIKGEKFKELKMERLKLDEYKCQICFKKVDEKTSHCHHITYLRVLNEKISDLSTLCPCCHKKLHEFHGKNKGHYPLISIEKLY